MNINHGFVNAVSANLKTSTKSNETRTLEQKYKQKKLHTSPKFLDTIIIWDTIIMSQEVYYIVYLIWLCI